MSQFLSDEARRYYEGGKRAIVDGIPVRHATFLSPAALRAKALIKTATEGGVGLDAGSVPDAPTFTFEPGTPPLENVKPSARGTAPRPKARLKSTWWTPSSISLAPNYQSPMAGDDWALTDARKAWADGNPKPLREWLEQQRQPQELKEAA